MVLEDLEIKGHKALWVGRGMSGKSWEMDEFDPNILYETLKEQIKKINTNQQNQRCLRKLSSVSVPSKCKAYDALKSTSLQTVQIWTLLLKN